MNIKIDPKFVYRKSDSAIVKEIEDELIIITTDNGISDINSSVYTVNSTGKAVWQQLDGIRSLEEIIETLSKEYNASLDRIRKDTYKIISEFISKGLVF